MLRSRVRMLSDRLSCCCGLRERYISDFDELEGGRGSPGATPSSIFNLATLAHPDLLFSLSGITYRKLPLGQQQPPLHWICALDPGCSSRCTLLTVQNPRSGGVLIPSPGCFHLHHALHVLGSVKELFFLWCALVAVPSITTAPQ